MLIIPIKEGENIDRALKRFKRKFDKTGIKRSLQTRQYEECLILLQQYLLLLRHGFYLL